MAGTSGHLPAKGRDGLTAEGRDGECPWRAAAATMGAVAIAGGAISFAGWVLDVPRLADWFDSGISIQPNTCVLLALSGGAVVLHASGRMRAALALGVVILGLSLATLLEHVVDSDFGFDNLLTLGRSWGGEATASPGRMGPPASISFTLIGLGVMLLVLRQRRGASLRRLVPIVALVVLTIVAFSLIGYLLHATPLYSLPWMTAIAMQTALLLAVVALGLMCCVPEHHPVLALRENTGASRMAAVALPLLILVPPLVSWLADAGGRLELYDSGTGRALGVVVIIVTTSALMWWALMALRRREANEHAKSQALRESEARLRGILDQLPVAVGVMDTRGAWVLSNSLMDDILPIAIASTRPEGAERWRAVDEAGKPVPPENWPGQRALRGERVVPGLEMLHRSAEGIERWMRLSAAPLRSDGGRIVGATYVVHDIDVIKRFQHRLEEELDRRTDEVRRAALAMAMAQRLAAVGTMAAGLAHDISNITLPLSVRLASLLEDPATSDAVRRELHVVTALVEHLRQMSADLSLFSRDHGSEGTEGSTDLVTWWERVRRLIESSRFGGEADRSRPKAAVTCDFPGDLPLVMVSPHRLTQMVLNLVHNAHDAIVAAQSSGTLAAGAGTIALVARTGPGGRTVRLSISDDGCGMDEETRLRALEPFFTTKDRPAVAGGSGSGMGLAIAHAICQRVGGSIEIHSQPGRGTRITLTLPVSPELAVATADDCAQTPAAPGRPATRLR